MVTQVSGRFPDRGGRRLLQGKRHDQEVKRDEGADRLRCHSVRKRAVEIEGEKKTDAQYATGGHK